VKQKRNVLHVPADGYVRPGEKKPRGGGITKCIFAPRVTFVTSEIAGCSPQLVIYSIDNFQNS
jgi:hypothetical protein